MQRSARMKWSAVAGSLCLTVLGNTALWGAPKPTAKLGVLKAPVISISVIEDYGGFGGRNAGGGQSWTLRSNGTVEHVISFTPAEMDYELRENPARTTGTFDPKDFQEMLRYLQYSKLFDLKAPPLADDAAGSTRITLARGGKVKSLLISDTAPKSAATAAGWVMRNLVRAITADTDWKNKAGLSVNTGLFGQFRRDAEGLTEEESYRFETPTFVVRNDKGKQVGVLQQTTVGGNFLLTLPPGTYRVTNMKSGEGPTADGGYSWQAVPAMVVVNAGRMTEVNIILQKTPATT